jgi:hypothetical protein
MVQYTMDRRFNIPWVAIQYAMGRPFDIPLQLPLTHNLRQDGFDIPWVG